MKLIINCETGEETLEELNAADIAQQKKDQSAINKAQPITDPFELARLALKESAMAKLSALGLTDEEVKAIIG